MNRSIQASPKNCRAPASLCRPHASRQFSTVDGPPAARGIGWWSISTRTVEPQISPFGMRHWHLPWSRFQTARLTCAGTYPGFDEGRGNACGFFTIPFRFAWRSRRRSSAASRISSVPAPGCEWESASRAASIFLRKRRDTVRWSRLSFAVSGSTESRAGAGGAAGRGGSGAGTGAGAGKLVGQPTALSVSAAEAAPEPPRPIPAPAPARDSVEPLTAKESRLHLTVSRRFLKKIEAARDALSHSHPGADTEEILEAALDLLLDRDAKRKGLVKKPLPSPRPSSKPGYVPAHVKRAVWARDQGRCQHRTATGEICGSTVRVEIDHHPIPRAAGGPSTVENCRLACDRHNDLAARRFFGDAWMDRFTRNPRAGPTDLRGRHQVRRG